MQCVWGYRLVRLCLAVILFGLSGWWFADFWIDDHSELGLIGLVTFVALLSFAPSVRVWRSIVTAVCLFLLCGLSIIAAIIGAYGMQKLGTGPWLSEAAPLSMAGMMGGMAILLVCSINHPTLRRGIHFGAVALMGSLAALLFVRWLHLFREADSSVNGAAVALRWAFATWQCAIGSYVFLVRGAPTPMSSRVSGAS